MKLGMVSCHGTNMLWYKNWADLEARGSKRARATFERETIYAAPPLSFLTKATQNYMSALLNFGIISDSFVVFYTLIEFLVI